MSKTLTRLLAVAMCIVMTLTAAPLGGFVGLVVSVSASGNEHITVVPDGYIGIYTLNDLNAVRDNPSQKYI